MERRKLLTFGLSGFVLSTGCLENIQTKFERTESDPCVGVRLAPDLSIKNFTTNPVTFEVKLEYKESGAKQEILHGNFEVRPDSEQIRGRLFREYLRRGESYGNHIIFAEVENSSKTEYMDIKYPAIEFIRIYYNDDGLTIDRESGYDSNESRSDLEECYWERESPVVSS